VVVTRAADQSREMIERLEHLGATVISCPTIEFAEPDDWTPADSAIDSLERYDWVVFTSANAVSFFFSRLKRRRPATVGLFETITTCAIGPATAKAIESEGVTVDVIARESRSEGALAAIVERVGGPEALSGVRFLIPRALVARDVLPAELRRLNSHVDVVEVYRTVLPDVDTSQLIRVFTEGSLDAITFTSSSTVSNFAALVGMNDLGELLKDAVAACIGAVTAGTAREHGVRNVVWPETSTEEALIDLIATALGPKP
jgi:uroporphyrinogen III methyltransferase/synthase